MLNEENAEYYKYTGPQRFDKAIHTLEGLVRGITSDGIVTDDEVAVLIDWIGAHREFADRHPFNEVIPRLYEVLDDGVIDDEERADVLWMCDKFTTDDQYYCKTTADMQRLQGILGGIVADSEITKDELESLQTWMREHEDLRTIWPYDELEALILSVLKDGVIDETEHRALIQFFSEFLEFKGHRTIQLNEQPETALVTGVCAVCPEIAFEEKHFCFTGRSDKYSRKDFAAEISNRGGIFSKSLTRETSYLIIGGDGNPCWAYACYGRKVEKAIEYRKTGGSILLVHEYDFRDAMEEFE